MTLTKPQVRDVVEVYVRSWETQDPALIVTIFAEEATYHERVLGEPIRGRNGIRRYWQAKVVGAQRDIRCRVLNLYLDGDTAIVEWEARFYDVEDAVRKRMREVAILEFEGTLIAHLREYWASEPVEDGAGSPGVDAGGG